MKYCKNDLESFLLQNSNMNTAASKNEDLGLAKFLDSYTVDRTTFISPF